MDVACKKCSNRIPPENVNVGKDTAYCSNCGNLEKLSHILESKASAKFDPNKVAKGVKIQDRNQEWSIEATHRSLMSLFIVPFTVVWAGFSLSGIYGTQIINGELDMGQSLFGMPFLIGSIVLICVSLMSINGRTLISVNNNKALIFIGVGSIGWYRRFDWGNIERITEQNMGQHKTIALEGDKRLTLGWGLSGKKLYYVANYLRSKLKS